MALAIPDEVPLWSYGFRYTVPKAFEIARRCKAEGGRIWPPLEDDLDIERDPDPSLAAKEMEDTRVSEEMSRAADVFEWATLFLQNKTGEDGLWKCIVSVHTGVTGTEGRSSESHIIEVASARAWKLADIDMEAVREEWEFPSEEAMAILREYLGDPEWFLESEYVYRNKLVPSLASGEFQAVVGIPVDSHPTLDDTRPHGTRDLPLGEMNFLETSEEESALQ